ncbi:helix-turn-helix domain-containing protein [Neisseria sp. Ec49-e6-T10]|uniref:helix-turn-helix domain-containing protein n=1 Tax=Neisseria sp. Ec49-e6-T10 TaxID=3140744 RepID=UPI003EBE0B7A
MKGLNMATYNVEEAASYCKCHKETIKKHIKSGNLIAVKVGRRLLVTQKDLDLFIENLKNTRLQEAQAERSKKCQSDCAVKFGKSMLSRKAVSELDSLLVRVKKPQHKNCTTK